MRTVLDLEPDRFAVCRLDPDASHPDWLTSSSPVLRSVTRTAAELSIVCAEAAVPAAVRAERGFRALRVQGTLDFALVGVLSSLLAPLAAAGVSVFVLSTFDTDWLLVRASALDRALAALRAAGFTIQGVG